MNPKEDKILIFTHNDMLLFDIGPKIYFGECGLERDDKKDQLARIGGEYWNTYKVPDDVEYGFIIVESGKGDTATK